MRAYKRKLQTLACLTLAQACGASAGGAWQTVTVPSGTYTVGNASPERRFVREFKIDAYEVTRDEYVECVSRRQCEALGAGRTVESNPYFPDEIVTLSYDEAVAMCRWRGGALPSNQEWEIAASAPDGRKYAWGNEFDERQLTDVTTIAEFDVGYVIYRRSSNRGVKSPLGVFDTSGTWAEFTVEDGRAFLRGAPTGAFTTNPEDFSNFQLRPAKTGERGAVRCVYRKYKDPRGEPDRR